MKPRTDTYDPANGLLTNKVYADGLGPRYEYDPAGRLAKRVWARGVETDYAYDALGQLVSIDYSDDTPDVAFTYDRLGRQLTVTDVLGTRTNVYDALNLLEERHPDGTALVRSYDAYGRASGIALGSDYAVSYGYDEYGRFSSVSVSNGATFTYSYVSNSSLLSGYTNDLGLAVAYEYEPLRDLKTLVSNAWGTNVISTFAYDYDAVGRRTQRVDSGLTTNVFAYNTRSELINAVMGSNTYAYAYDPIGNRLFASENGTQTTYAANSLNQYTALNPASTNPTPFTYDPDGNMTSDGTWSYTWDAENRLIEVQPLVTNLDSTLVQYMYDAQSRRIARREFAWMAFLHDDPAWRYVQGRAYRYDDRNLLQELKPATTPRTPPTYIPQTDLSLTGVTGLVAATYVWGLDLSQSLHGVAGVGGLLETFLENTNTFYVHDANGNIILQINDAGSARELSKYAPYGRVLGTNVHEQLFQFQTKCFEPITKTYDFGYRHYAPEYGRWLSRDPLEEMAGANRVAFVENNPVNVIDIVGRLSYRVIESRIAEDDEFPLGPGGVRPYALTKLITNKLQYQVQKCGEGSGQIVYTPQTWIIHIRYRVAPETRVHGLYFKTVRDHEFYHVEIIKIFLQQLEEAMSSFSKCECIQCMSQKRQMVDAYTKSIGLAMAATHAKFDCNDYFGPSTPDNARGARCREARSLYESLRKANADYLNLQRDWLACKYGEKR